MRQAKSQGLAAVVCTATARLRARFSAGGVFFGGGGGGGGGGGVVGTATARLRARFSAGAFLRGGSRGGRRRGRSPTLCSFPPAPRGGERVADEVGGERGS